MVVQRLISGLFFFFHFDIFSIGSHFLILGLLINEIVILQIFIFKTEVLIIVGGFFRLIAVTCEEITTIRNWRLLWINLGQAQLVLKTLNLNFQLLVLIYYISNFVFQLDKLCHLMITVRSLYRLLLWFRFAEAFLTTNNLRPIDLKDLLLLSIISHKRIEFLTWSQLAKHRHIIGIMSIYTTYIIIHVTF